MEKRVQVLNKITLKKVEMVPADHLSMEEAIQRLEALGHIIIRVDVPTRTITVAHKE